MNRKVVRRDDPATSHAAAKSIDRRVGATIRLRMLCVWQHHAGTMQEIAHDCVRHFGGRVESYRKRGSELKSSQAIVRVGTRTCQITGASADVFKAAR
jgi:monoamine oxidase